MVGARYHLIRDRMSQKLFTLQTEDYLLDVSEGSSLSESPCPLSASRLSSDHEEPLDRGVNIYLNGN